MKSEDFSVWLSAISGMGADQRAEALAALKKAAAGEAASGAKEGQPSRRTRLGRAASSGLRLRGVRIARAARLSAGVVRTGFCAIAARAAGARSTR